VPNLVKKSISTLVAAATVAGTLAVSGTGAQARGFYGVPVAAGVIGGLALGAMAAEAAVGPRYARVVEHRYVRKNGKLHYCGCVVRHVRY
jgi:hypothetical protein